MYLGIDQSLRSTGIISLTSTTSETILNPNDPMSSNVIGASRAYTGISALADITYKMTEQIRAFGDDIHAIAMEGYSYGSRG